MKPTKAIAAAFNRLDRNARVVVICASVVASMAGLAYASVPLYDLFCRVTGYGGTTQVAQFDAGQILDREVTVRFDASRARDFPLEFEPLQRSMRVRVGETALAFYRVTNTTSEPVTGIASYNVAPFKTGPYFAKLECFCFTDQTIPAGETMDMPVIFFVDPQMDGERTMDDVQTITLSYTFWRSGDSRAWETADAS
ncbi:cytochrome c oxidase assembly protein [Alkalicaulis satelles]|uniref:Cytochrome c oxidase assembly protein CtaG n=1 Tax=Alkalicaulis satelles TaxID=2609175 RepID=A0A5M6ZA90_9PROT|nr:cytochrome c oxidase assembly protein [Alkalicaulis satelles]KAA5801616.1 cytochrome c oxidase assembly protein [Alkalicaulis satelles]